MASLFSKYKNSFSNKFPAKLSLNKQRNSWNYLMLLVISSFVRLKTVNVICCNKKIIPLVKRERAGLAEPKFVAFKSPTAASE